jgi:molecular chaperone GrpE (heat shock protein)
VKAQARQTTKAKAGGSGIATAESSEQRMQADLQKQLKDAEREAVALESRLSQLQAEWDSLQQQRMAKDQEVQGLLQQQELFRQQLELSARQRCATRLSPMLLWLDRCHEIS